MASLLRGGLGYRPLDAGDVLLTGQPGRGEFVQIVGLGIGRPPVAPNAVPPSAALVAPPLGWTPPRHRRRWALAMAVAAVVAAAAVLVATARGGGDVGEAAAPQRPSGPPGPVATMPDPVERIIRADVADLDGRPLIVASTADGAIHTWDAGTGENVRPPIPGDAKELNVTAVDGRPVVVATTKDGTLVLRDVQSGGLLAPPAGRPGQFSHGGVTPTQIDGPAI